MSGRWRVLAVAGLGAMLLGAGSVAVSGQAQEATPAVALTTLSSIVDHPLMPLASVRVKIFVGEQRDDESGETIATRIEETTLAQTETVAGVAATVVEVKEYEDGELVEATRDYYAQGADGTVYYLGERVDDYEDGRLVGHSGEWVAGENGAQAGVYMPATIAVGESFEQEQAPGVAEDRSTVVALDQALTTPAGSFRGCVKTEDVNPLDGAAELKFYCPGVGLVRAESADGFAELVAFEGGEDV